MWRLIPPTKTEYVSADTKLEPHVPEAAEPQVELCIAVTRS
jgi:hypothetical protein